MAKVIGRTIDQVKEKKLQNEISYGVVAKNYDYLEESHASMLENKIAILKERVAERTLTLEKADELITTLKKIRQLVTVHDKQKSVRITRGKLRHHDGQ